MAMTPEGKVKKNIKDVLNMRGIVYCMPATYGLGCSGVSDFIACYKGQFLSIEAKAGKGTTTALQDKWLERVSAAGGWSMVVYEGGVGILEQTLDMIERTHE